LRARQVLRARPVLRAPVALGAAALLTALLATGCGVFQTGSGSAGASSGMERQILNGERISAATKASARSTGNGSSARSAGRHKVTGREVTAIGDSVMLAGAWALHSVLPGIYIDAKPSRQWSAGLAVVRGLAAAGRLRPVVVVGLGTNYIVTTGQLNELTRLLGPHRKLVLINTYEQDQWAHEVNATIAAYVSKHPDIVLADWYDTIKDHTGLLWPDQVHPELPGTRVYARMVYRAVEATRGVTVPASASHSLADTRTTAPSPG
jgi:hypothetical protein